MKTRGREVSYEIGSENVFADLGFENAAEELAKAKLVRAICAIVTKRKLKQTEAARVLGIPQPKASLLLRGRTAGFSTERLMRFLNRLDQDVDISVKPKRRALPALSVHALQIGAALAEPHSPSYVFAGKGTDGRRARRRVGKARQRVARKRK